MKILYVIESAGGGSGRHTLDLAKALSRQGHNITLLYSAARIENWFQKEINQLDSIKTGILKIGNLPAGLSYIQGIWSLRKTIIKTGPFDIIHAQSSKAGGMARLAAIGNSAKIIYTPHAFITLDFTMNPVKRKIYALVENILARFTDEIICVSHEEAEHGEKYIGIENSKLNMIENGKEIIQTDAVARTKARKLMALEDSTICAGFVGRLCPQKAVKRLLDAMALINKETQQLKLKIIGDGPDKPELEKYNQALGLTEYVEFLGAVPAGNYLPGFDFFVLPSLYEGFPYVLLEAAQTGLPIIATPTGGTHAVIKHGETGYICDSENPVPDMKNYCLTLTNDQELRQQQSDNILELGRTFTITTMVAKTLNVYQKNSFSRQGTLTKRKLNRTID